MIISIAYKFSKRKYYFIPEEVSLIALFFHYQPPYDTQQPPSAKFLQPILNCNNSKVESSPPISAKICHPIKILNAHNWVEQGRLVLYFLIKFCNFDPSSCYMLLSNAYTQCNLICTIYLIDFMCFYDKFLHISRHIQSNGIENTFLKTLSNVHTRQVSYSYLVGFFK